MTPNRKFLSIVSHRDDYLNLEDAESSGAVYAIATDIEEGDQNAIDMAVQSAKNTADMYGQDKPPLYLMSGDVFQAEIHYT